ncbi:YadA-like family protein [Escherichia coli]|nr:YadA-like family protein [Escherichia coli]
MKIFKLNILITALFFSSFCFSGENSTATGAGSSAHGDYSTATGYSSSAEGNNSTAIGHGTYAKSNNSTAIGYNSVADRENTVSFGNQENKRQLVNVENGTEDNDAVNVSQLNNAKSEAITISNNYTDSKITENNTVINQNIDNSKNEAIDISNAYTDKKVENVTTSVTNEMKNYTDNSSKQTLIDANSYTDKSSRQTLIDANKYTDAQINTVNSRVDNLDNKVDKNRQKAAAGIAGAMAMSSIPQNLSYDFNFGMGVANFDSEQAISAGGYYRVNKRTIVSVKSSFDTQNNLGVAAGLSYGW